MSNLLCLYPGPASFRQREVGRNRDLLASLGVRLLLADDYDDPGDSACFADVIAMPPPQELAAGKRVLDRALAGKRVDAVVAQSESGICLGALFAAERGLPCLPLEAALLTTSKYGTRTALEAAGVAQPRFALAHAMQGVQDVRRFAASHGYPVVIKATASALARLVTLVRSEAEVELAVARLLAGLQRSPDVQRLSEFAEVAGLELGHDPRESFLVESFVRGLPLETDGVVSRDTIVDYGVTEQVMTAPPLFFFEGYLLPADLTATERAAVERTSGDALRALGVRDTGFSVELRWLDGRASIVEVNGRLGWDAGFGDIFEVAAGAQPVLQALQVALGMPVAPSPRPDVRCAVAYAACYEDRVVARVPDADEIRAVEREHGVRAGVCVWPGDRLYAPPSIDIAPHVAWVLATDPASSRAAYERARSLLPHLPVELRAV